MSVSAFFNIDYRIYTWTFNLLCFTFEIIWGRKYIHIGTFINWFLVSYAVQFFLDTHESLTLPTPQTLPMRVLLLLVALPVISLGLAIYQEADLGIAPYDVIPIMFCERHPKFPYFWARIILDSSAVIGILATGSSLIGIGTLLTALGLGPIINMFSVILEKIFPSLKEGKAKKA